MCISHLLSFSLSVTPFSLRSPSLSQSALLSRSLSLSLCLFLSVSQISVSVSICLSLSLSISDLCLCPKLPCSLVPTGSPSRGGDVAVYVFDVNQPSLPNPVYSVLVSISVFIALSTVFHSITSPDSSPLSHSVLPVLFLPYGPFSYISLYESLLQP